MARELPYLARWRNAVRDTDELTLAAKCVLFVLSTYARGNGDVGGNGVNGPSRKTLAERSGTSEKTVSAAVDAGEQLGLLKIFPEKRPITIKGDVEVTVMRRPGGKGVTNTFKLTIDSIEYADAKEGAELPSIGDETGKSEGAKQGSSGPQTGKQTTHESVPKSRALRESVLEGGASDDDSAAAPSSDAHDKDLKRAEHLIANQGHDYPNEAELRAALRYEYKHLTDDDVIELVDTWDGQRKHEEVAA